LLGLWYLVWFREEGSGGMTRDQMMKKEEGEKKNG